MVFVVRAVLFPLMMWFTAFFSFSLVVLGDLWEEREEADFTLTVSNLLPSWNSSFPLLHVPPLLLATASWSPLLYLLFQLLQLYRIQSLTLLHLITCKFAGAFPTFLQTPQFTCLSAYSYTVTEVSSRHLKVILSKTELLLLFFTQIYCATVFTQLLRTNSGMILNSPFFSHFISVLLENVICQFYFLHLSRILLLLTIFTKKP